MQRSIWITHEDWELIRIHAALTKETLSKYLLNLHKMNITSRGIIPPVIAVHKDEPRVLVLDQDPKVEKKQGSDEFFRPRPKGQDGIKKK